MLSLVIKSFTTTQHFSKNSLPIAHLSLVCCTITFSIEYQSHTVSLMQSPTKPDELKAPVWVVKHIYTYVSKKHQFIDDSTWIQCQDSYSESRRELKKLKFHNCIFSCSFLLHSWYLNWMMRPSPPMLKPETIRPFLLLPYLLRLLNTSLPPRAFHTATQPWLVWNLMCRQGWPQTHRAQPVSASSILGLK